MITRKNESKVLSKHILCIYKYKFSNVICNLMRKRNRDKCQCQCKKRIKLICKIGYACNPTTCSCETYYLENIIDDLSIACNEIVNMTKDI